LNKFSYLPKKKKKLFSLIFLKKKSNVYFGLLTYSYSLVRTNFQLVFVSIKLHSSFMILLFCSANLQSRVKKGKMTQEKFEKTISLLKGALDYESFKDVDIVIEVVQNAC
jgi:hypothetical protein